MRTRFGTTQLALTRALHAGGALLAAVVAGGVTLSLNTSDAEAVVRLPTEHAADGAPADVADVGERATPEIVDWPIEYDATRAKLTGAFLEKRREDWTRSGDVWKDAAIVPRVVVLHHTAGPTAESAYHTFRAAADPRPGLKDYQKLNLSTHFLVERDGTIYRLFPETLAGRHAIGLNHVAIGVENVGGIEGYPLTDEQVEANVALVRYLEGKYDTLTHVIGHHEYRKMEDHPYFDEYNAKYRTVKSDPGDAFMKEVRAGIADLDLQGPPGRDGAAGDGP